MKICIIRKDLNMNELKFPCYMCGCALDVTLNMCCNIHCGKILCRQCYNSDDHLCKHITRPNQTSILSHIFNILKSPIYKYEISTNEKKLMISQYRIMIMIGMI